MSSKPRTIVIEVTTNELSNLCDAQLRMIEYQLEAMLRMVKSTTNRQKTLDELRARSTNLLDMLERLGTLIDYRDRAKE